MKIVKKAFLIIVLVSLSLLLGVFFLKNYMLAEAAPSQPINFNHSSHVRENKISCHYCHIYARNSSVSGMPSVERCLGCHSSIKNIKKGRKDLLKLIDYGKKKKPIAWVKVYNLPDYIYFTHQGHIEDVKCSKCHGDVESMKIIRRVTDMNMGWCLRCHSKMNAPTADCWGCHI